MLAGVPGLLALIVCIWRGPESAFLNVYLPALLLLPDSCRMAFSGQLNFGESAIVPIFVYYLWTEGRDWEWTFTDCIVLTFVSLVSIAEYMNADFSVAKNLALRTTTVVLMPYVVAKGLSARDGLNVALAKRIVILAAVVAIVSLYEFRMTFNPFLAFLSPLFPDLKAQIPGFRYGFVRVQGPWTHPILAGIILADAYRIARWLEWTHNWPGNVSLLSISKVRFCELAFLIGSLMTISRGPWIGAAVAAVLVMLLRAPHRTYVTILACIAIFAL